MRVWAWIVLGALALTAGCSGGSSSSPPVADAAKPSTASFKVALLTPGPVTDGGWSAMAFEGLKAIEADMQATVSNQEATSAKIKDAMRSYAQDGYALVFGHGFEYNEPAIEVAKNFPDTVFVSSSGSMTAKNVGAFRFYLEQGFYLAGMAAASLSKSGKVAMIGGDDVPSIRSTFEAFAAGARAVNPKIQVIEKFTGSGQDVAKARQATLAAIDQGADYVIHQANAAADGVFNACKERGVKAFGANLDQNAHPSGVVLASAIIVAKPAFLELARSVKAGTFEGKIVLRGMEHEAIDFVWNPEMISQLPGDLVKKIMDTRDKIRSGELIVPKREF